MSLYILILLIFTGCENSNQSNQAEANQPIEAPAVNDTFNEYDDEDQQQMIVGKFSKEELMEGPFAGWFNRGYEGYEPSKESIETIKNSISQYEIVGFIGTWCPDSRRELPKFYKILDEAGFDLSQLTMVGVDRSKSTPENLEDGYDMHRVPTFIFLKDGKEVNRYVEYAGETIEADIARIVTGQEYKNAYHN